MLGSIRATLARWGEAMAIFCGAKSMSILCMSMLAGLKGRVWQSMIAEQSLQIFLIRMGDVNAADGQFGQLNGRKKIILNAFDMSTVGHLSPGQWKVSVIRSQSYTLGFQLTNAESNRQVSHEAKAWLLDRAREAAGTGRY
jgi:hypothetical protein